MNRLIALAVAAIVVIYLISSSIYVVGIRDQAIVLRFGQITAVRTEPGLYFKLPTSLVDSVQIIENRLLRYDIANMQVQVSDGAKYVVDAFLTYRISDPTLFRQRLQGDLGLAEQKIAARLNASLPQVYGLRKFDAALSAERPAMMREARDLIRPGMTELGIDVTDVRILRTDLMPDVSKNTFDRMSAERFAQAAAIRAGGQQEALSLRAIADRQAVEIQAAARKDGEILRGEGEALRSEVFAAAFSPDPEFFEFYRSLQAYRTAMAQQTGTTMVLAPDSAFFDYFNEVSKGGLPVTPAAPNGIPPLPDIPVTDLPSDVQLETPPPADDGLTPPPTADLPETTAPATELVAPAN